MTCRCGNAEAHYVKTSFTWNENRTERVICEYCDKCGGVGGSIWVPDVYDYTEPLENLCDRETGRPLEFVSRTHKARYMRERNVSEVGDRVHGAAYSIADANKSLDRTAARAEIRQALQRVRQMPPEQKRAMMQRIRERGHA